MSGSVIIDLNIIADVLEFFCNETQNNLGGITMRQIGTQSAKYYLLNDSDARIRDGNHIFDCIFR